MQVKMKRQQIAHFSYVEESETFIPDFDKSECYDLNAFLEDFQNAYYRSGVWNEYKLIPMQEAIERCKKTPYGADIYIEYDEAYELGEGEGRCDVYFSCPCNSDMW